MMMMITVMDLMVIRIKIVKLSLKNYCLTHYNVNGKDAYDDVKLVRRVKKKNKVCPEKNGAKMNSWINE